VYTNHLKTIHTPVYVYCSIHESAIYSITLCTKKNLYLYNKIVSSIFLSFLLSFSFFFLSVFFVFVFFLCFLSFFLFLLSVFLALWLSKNIFLFLPCFLLSFFQATRASWHAGPRDHARAKLTRIDE